MFGLSWGEIGLIMAAALIFIGPKDLPVAVRTVTSLVKKARGMASEFQSHVDEMMREANLSDVKSEISKLAKFDFKTAAETAIDPDGAFRATMADPFHPDSLLRKPEPVVEALPDTPAFIPPEAARKKPVPGFIPPGIKRWGF